MPPTRHRTAQPLSSHTFNTIVHNQTRHNRFCPRTGTTHGLPIPATKLGSPRSIGIECNGGEAEEEMHNGRLPRRSQLVHSSDGEDRDNGDDEDGRENQGETEVWEKKSGGWIEEDASVEGEEAAEMDWMVLRRHFRCEQEGKGGPREFSRGRVPRHFEGEAEITRKMRAQKKRGGRNGIAKTNLRMTRGRGRWSGMAGTGARTLSVEQLYRFEEI